MKKRIFVKTVNKQKLISLSSTVNASLFLNLFETCFNASIAPKKKNTKLKQDIKTRMFVSSYGKGNAFAYISGK